MADHHHHRHHQGQSPAVNAAINLKFFDYAPPPCIHPGMATTALNAVNNNGIGRILRNGVGVDTTNSRNNGVSGNNNNNNNNNNSNRLSTSSRPGSSVTESTASAVTASSNNNGATEVMLACQSDDLERVNSIIQHNGSTVVLARDRYGRTALHYATEVGALRCSEVLLFHQPRLLQEQDIDGCSALHGAVIAGNLAAVRWLIQRGASPDATDNEQHTVLHWATVSAHPEIVEYLLREVKIKPLPDLHHAYPLHYAAQMCGADNQNQNGNGTSVQSVTQQHQSSGTPGLTTQMALLTLLKLVECGHPLDVCDEDNRQPLVWAANNGAAEACYVLVSSGASVDAADKDGLTALHCAATRGQARCLAALLSECGARHDVQDSNKCTPLFYAATFGHLACCRILAENGANPNHVDRKRRTAAHCAASKGHLDCLKYLIAVGANIWLRSVKGDYPISEAIANGHTNLVTQLLNAFTPEQRNALAKVRRGRTPLHSAAAANQLELCKVLLDFGSPVNALHHASSQYYSPYDFAVIRGNVEVAEYLRARGAAPATKVIKHATRVLQKYCRAWNAKKRTVANTDRRTARPKSITSERSIRLTPIVQPAIKEQPSPQQHQQEPPLLDPVELAQQQGTLNKKPRPTHQRNRSRVRTMADDESSNNNYDSTAIDASASFFDDEPAPPKKSAAAAAVPTSPAKPKTPPPPPPPPPEPLHTSSSAPSVAQQQEQQQQQPQKPLHKSVSNASNLHKQVEQQRNNNDEAVFGSSSPQPAAITTNQAASLNYDEYPQDGVRIEITTASSRSPVTPSATSAAAPPNHHAADDIPVFEITGSTNDPIDRSQQQQSLHDFAFSTNDSAGSGSYHNNNQKLSSRPISGSSSQMQHDLESEDLEKMIQRSTSGGETLSIRDEDGGESEAESELVGNVGHSNESFAAGDESKLTQSSGVVDGSSSLSTTEHQAHADPTSTTTTTHQTYSRAQSSTKSVRIMETPIMLEPARVEADQYDQQDDDDDEREHQSQQRLWVDALGRAHQTSATMKPARPLQRLRQKSSVVRVKSVSEQVHKNVNQYERQRALIEELKRLKRLQISKRNGVDPQFVSRSFSAMARKNNMINSTGDIDDAEKLLYDELYRRRLTEYRYVPEYHVEPSNDFAIYQVHNDRSPPMTTSSPWASSSRHAATVTGPGSGRAKSAPLGEPGIRRHYEVNTKRINHAMAERVEKAYVPQPHVQQLLDREDQLNSARSNSGLAHHAAATPRMTIIPGGALSGEGMRPHTSPGKIQHYGLSSGTSPLQQQLQQQQVPSTSTTTVISRGGFIKVRQGQAGSTPTPTPRDNSAKPQQQANQQQRHTSGSKTTPNGKQAQRASANHSPYMQPLLASLIETKGVKAADQSTPRLGSNVNLPEV